MSATALERRRRVLIDRRLLTRAAVTRRYLVIAVVVGLVSTLCVVAQAVLLGSVVSDVVLHGSGLAAVAARLAGLAAAFAARAACVWAGESAAQRTGAIVTSALRRQLLRHALALGPSWLSRERAGELSLAATRGTAALDVYFGRYLPQALLAGLAPAALLAWVGWEDWASLLILLALTALVPVAMTYFGRQSSARTARQWRRLSSLSARFLELVRGLPTLRAFGQEPRGRREVAEATEGLRKATMSSLRVAFLSALALEFVAGIGTGLVAMVLGLRLLDGKVTLYTALAVLLVSPEVFLPLRRAGAEFHASTEGQAAAERILSVLDQPVMGASADANHAVSGRTGGTPPVADRRGVGVGHNGESDGSALPFDLSAKGLHVSHATVRFPGRATAAIEDFDLALARGEHVALVGPSGAGKSTVISLLLGFVRPEAGAVFAGGVDLARADLAAWRRHISWVPQQPHLLHGTLGDNLRLADPSASDEQLRAVTELVGLGAMVAELPDRFETSVGEGGLQLSAGERQRLAIARAVLRDAPVVLLDEPVAHLDRFSEEELATALARWLEARTVLVAAHRPELVARIDRVVELGTAPSEPVAERALRSSGGRTAEDGDPQPETWQ